MKKISIVLHDIESLEQFVNIAKKIAAIAKEKRINIERIELRVFQ